MLFDLSYPHHIRSSHSGKKPKRNTHPVRCLVEFPGQRCNVLGQTHPENFMLPTGRCIVSIYIQYWSHLSSAFKHVRFKQAQSPPKASTPHLAQTCTTPNHLSSSFLSIRLSKFTFHTPPNPAATSPSHPCLTYSSALVVTAVSTDIGAPGASPGAAVSTTDTAAGDAAPERRRAISEPTKCLARARSPRGHGEVWMGQKGRGRGERPGWLFCWTKRMKR